jgi:hypothetical protein
MKYTEPQLYIALPVLDEWENIEKFINVIRNQTYKKFILYVCVNQPDIWWNIDEKKSVCERNVLTLNYLKSISDIKIQIIDKSTPENGWQGKQLGVGWARKILMDEINDEASDNDIVISLDADTDFSAIYFESIISNLEQHPKIMAISVPYYHKLTENEDINRAILRYEIYMRYYAINLWRIGSPFNFTALGSAIAFPIWAYRKIGGISPMKSGEDFYFLQKFCKVGRIINWNTEKVYPAARFSDRVFFGTGPAMIKGNSGDWESYPIYHYSLFDNVLQTYSQFENLFEKDIELQINQFLIEQFKDKCWWHPLRKNFKTKEKFVKACYEKVDGLRVLQYLKCKQASVNKTDEECFYEFLEKFYPEVIIELSINKVLKFNELSILELDKIRNRLMEIEEEYQKNDFMRNIK